MRMICYTVDGAWSLIRDYRLKETQLEEVREMFAKKQITNITRIRLNQRIVNGERKAVEQKGPM